MENQFILPGTSSDDIDNFIENDSNVREGNERKYLYPQYLYELLLQRKDINIEIKKPNNIGIKEYNYVDKSISYAFLANCYRIRRRVYS
jgi:hypothetical protein